jgi:predicted transglutaminase-like protease
MQERTKAQITIGLLAFFASVWILFEGMQPYSNPIYSIGIVFLLLVVMLVLSYVIISILAWINIFDLKTNAILTLIVLTAFMINLTIYLLKG